jgi:hypothetical protein
MGSLIFIDCEAPFGKGSPAVADMTEFGAVEYKTRKTFHGEGHSKETFDAFWHWLMQFKKPWVMVSDNPAYDWQWINFYFWKYYGQNPLGHSARRIGDFYAGLNRDFWNASKWKRFRITQHTHRPVDDAMGNVEAFEHILQEYTG